MKIYQQGDVRIIKTEKKIEGEKLPHLILAEGEATGHAHTIISGNAGLYNMKGALYLQILSETALLAHQEHGRIELPIGIYEVRQVQEYDHFAEEARKVID